MANNGNESNENDKQDGKIKASSEKKKKGSLYSESYADELDKGLVGINNSLSRDIFAVGNVTEGKNQDTSKENLDEELAPRTNKTANSNSKKSTPTTAPNAIEVVKSPSLEDEETKEIPEPDTGKLEVPAGDSADNPDTPNDGKKGSDKGARAANEDLKKTAAKQDQKKQPEEGKSKDDKDSKKSVINAANSGIVAKIMNDYKTNIEAKEERKKVNSKAVIGDNDSTKNAIAQDKAKKTQKKEGKANKEAVDPDTTTEDKPKEKSDDKSSTDNSGTGTANQAESKDDLPDLDVELSTEEKAKFDKNAAEKADGKRKGLDVGRSSGYGAKIDKGGKNITPFGKDQESASQALNAYRDAENAKAQSSGDIYYQGYAQGYNEGLGEGISLKREADGAQRKKTLDKEKSTTEYKAGVALGTACGAAAAKGQKEIDASYNMPKEGGGQEKIEVKSAIAPVRNAAMNDEKTPDGRLEGEALGRAFILHYNMAQREASQQRAKGPEKDANYQAGYERGYKLGSQVGEGLSGDEALLKERSNLGVEGTSKAEKQQKIGFAAGYNKGMYNVAKKNQDAKKKAREERNSNPIFMSGFSTGNMQGFLKAILASSEIGLVEALNNPQKMEEGGVPKFFPIPDAIRKNLKGVLGAGGDESVQTLIAKPLFKEGLLKGYNRGYAYGDQNRMNFKREQFKLHPDYQESLKIVYDDGDKGKTMGGLKAMLKTERDKLQGQETLAEEDKAKLETYNNTLAGLDAEVSKKSEYYQRGVIEEYNKEIVKQEKGRRAAAKHAVLSDPVYLEGFQYGVKVANKAFESKKALKEYRRNGLDITEKNANLNKAIKNAMIASKRKGNKYFNGYARGYSDTLRKRERAGNESNMGNKLTDKDVENKAKNIASGTGGDIDNFNTITGGGLTKQDLVNLYKAEGVGIAEKAFKQGAIQGYNLYYENRIDPATGKEVAGVDYKALYQKQLKDKKQNAEAYYFMQGFAFEKENEKYGAPKGRSDAKDYRAGYAKAKIEAERTETKEETKADDIKSTDAYNSGYKAGLRAEQYQSFRSRMIATQANQKIGSVEGVTNVDHTQHAATENSLADTSALSALSNDDQKAQVADATLSKQEGNVYKVNSAEHEAVAKQNMSNRQWLTKVLYLKDGLDLMGTDLGDKTLSIKVVDEKGDTTTKAISNQPKDTLVAREFYGNRGKYIAQLADSHVKTVSNSDDVLKQELGAASKDLEGKYAEGIKVKLEEIKAAYIKGYTELLAELESELTPLAVKEWEHDIGYIEALKEHAGDQKGVESLQLPTGPKTLEELNREKSKGYQEGYSEGLNMAQRVKSGLAILEGENMSKAQGNDYELGYAEGKSIGIKKAKDAAIEIQKKPPSQTDIKQKVAEHMAEMQMEIDPEYERGYTAGFFADYWKVRDFNYGRRLGYDRAKQGDPYGAIEPESNVEIKDREAFFNGFNKGRENAAAGKEESSTGAEGEEKTSYEAKLKNIVLEVAWRNASRKAAEELKIISKLPMVFDSKNRLYHPFAKNKSVKPLAPDSQALSGVNTTGDKSASMEAPSTSSKNSSATDNAGMGKKGSTSRKMQPYKMPEAYAVDGLEQIVKLPAVNRVFSEANQGSNANWAKASEEQKYEYARIFKEVYDKCYEATYQEALVDMTGLAMFASMDQGGSSSAGEDDNNAEEGNHIQDLIKQIEDLFEHGTHQNFNIDDLEIIDRFYDLESRIEERNYPISKKLEDLESYSLLMEHYEDADATLANAEMQQLKTDIQELKEKKKGAKWSEKKAIEKEKRALERSLREKRALVRKKSREEGTLQREWEKAEDEVEEEIDSIRVYMKDNLKFDTPLYSNDDILEYIKVNLETSEQHGKGEKVYQDIEIFNNLVLGGDFTYKESSSFDAFIQGDGRLTIDAEAEKMRAEGASIKVEREGFRFTAKGLEHDHSTNSFTLFDGNLVTPKIEGGRHEGVKLDYNYNTFRLQKGYTIKSQIEMQIDRLKGG